MTFGHVVLLADWQRRLLGLSPELGREIERARLFLAAGIPVRMAATILVLGAIWFAVIYLRDGSRPSLWVKGPLLALRLTALSALLVALLQPAARLTRAERQRGVALLLVDESLSMGFRDPRLPADRAARAAAALGTDARTLTRAQVVERAANRPDSELLATLIARHDVRLYRFSSEAAPVPIDAPGSGGRPASAPRLQVRPDPRGTSTQIGDALRRALDDAAGRPVAGALIITDGGQNLGADPVAVARSARADGIAVSAAGVGDPTPTRDVALTEALADQVVRKGNIVQVFAGIVHRGFAGTTARVTLRRDGQVAETRSVRLGAAGTKQAVAFTYTPRQEGHFSYSLSVDPLPREVTRANNARRFVQQVVGKRLKVLYIDGEPRWEYRYLKNAILRDKRIAFSCYLTAIGPIDGGEGNLPIRAFPPDDRSLFEFDILILGDVPRRYFSDLQIRNMRRFVEDRGGSIIAIAGEKHMPHEYAGTPLASVFPVVIPATPEPIITDEPAGWELTADGREDPALRLADDPVESERVWRGLPGMYWCAGVPRARPGATVLAVNAARSNPAGKRIALAVQPFGAGRCLMQLTDGTWRWRWRVGDRYFYRYWGQIVRAMTPREPPGGNRFAQVSVGRSDFALGDRVAISARLLDGFYRPVRVGEAVATIAAEVGTPRKLTLRAVPGSPGLFAGEMLADRQGIFRVTVASPARPSEPATARYAVQSLTLEQQQPEMNERLLKQIAAGGGGRYYGVEGLSEWARSLPDKALVVRSETEVNLWNAPLMLLLFVVPLAIEWLVRKRTGML
ncbi:MAG: hypothetical protein IT208_07615 [Chthonomonadales bacterium]|nr:hypothetical protein [Chthonomonadales bacterium]